MTDITTGYKFDVQTPLCELKIKVLNPKVSEIKHVRTWNIPKSEIIA